MNAAVNLYPKSAEDRLADAHREIACMRALLMQSAERHKESLSIVRDVLGNVSGRINTAGVEEKKRLIRAEAALLRHVRRTRTIVTELGLLAARAEGYQS